MLFRSVRSTWLELRRARACREPRHARPSSTLLILLSRKRGGSGGTRTHDLRRLNRRSTTELQFRPNDTEHTTAKRRAPAGIWRTRTRGIVKPGPSRTRFRRNCGGGGSDEIPQEGFGVNAGRGGSLSTRLRRLIPRDPPSAIRIKNGSATGQVCAGPRSLCRIWAIMVSSSNDGRGF